MPTRSVQQVIVAIVAFVWLVLALIAPSSSNSALSPAPLKLYSVGAATVGLALLAYDRFLWKLRFVRLIRPVPVLAGTWRGRLTSSYIGASGETFVDIPVYLLVSQTSSSLSATLMSARSRSNSILAHLLRAPDKTWKVTWTYLGSSTPGERATNPMHNGLCELMVAGKQGERLVGSYFTDRLSRGEMTFDAASAAEYRDYESASNGSDYTSRRTL